MSDIFSSQALSNLFKLGLVHLCILFLFVLDTISYNITLSEAVKPYFIIICIYFWSIYRPSLLQPIYVFAIGLLYGMILNYPMGLHAALFLLLQWIVRDQRLYFLGQPYSINWIAFGFSCFCVFALEWVFFTLTTANSGASHYDFHRVLYGTAITAIVYPVISWMFHQINRILPPVSQPHFV